MAFCEKCGKQLAAGEVCTCQSAPIQSVNIQPTNKQPAAESSQPKRNSKKKNNLPIIIGIAAIAIVAVIIIITVTSSKPYMKPINDFIKAINSKTTNQLNLSYTLQPEFCVKANKKVESALKDSDDHIDSLEDTNEYLEDCYDNCDDEFDSWKLSFEVKSAEKMDEDDLEELQDYCNDYYDDYLDGMRDSYEDIADDEDDLEDLADNFDISEKQAKAYATAVANHYAAHEDVKITDGYEIKGKFIVKTDEDEYKTDTVTVRVVKINGDWAYAGIVKGSCYFEDEASCFNFLSSYLNYSQLFD